MTDKVLATRETLSQLLRERKLDVVLTLGAGDIDRSVPEVQRLLNEIHRP
jgi:UDP-N-acetylmuramate-alanine ligase